MPAFDHDSTLLSTKESRFVLCHEFEEPIYLVKSQIRNIKASTYSTSTYTGINLTQTSTIGVKSGFLAKICCCFFSKKSNSEGDYTVLGSS